MAETVQINGNTFRVLSWGETRAQQQAKKRKAHRVIEKVLDGEPVERGTLTLSLAPPSVNSLFNNARKGRRKTLRYANWCAAVDAELRAQPSWHVPGKVRVTIRSAGAIDADNRNKAPIDALVRVGRIEGDSPKHVVDCRAVHDPDARGTRIEIEKVPQ